MTLFHEIVRTLLGIVLIFNGCACAFLSTRMKEPAKQGGRILALPQLAGGLMLTLGG